MNIDQIHQAISETPCDDDPWSVQLLELLDQSIANHFPNFDFPRWELLHPELPTVSTVEKQGDEVPTPDCSVKTPDPEVAFQSPKEDGTLQEEDSEVKDLTDSSRQDVWALEVPDSPIASPDPRDDLSKPKWQTVVASDTEAQELPIPLKPAKSTPRAHNLDGANRLTSQHHPNRLPKGRDPVHRLDINFGRATVPTANHYSDLFLFLQQTFSFALSFPSFFSPENFSPDVLLYSRHSPTTADCIIRIFFVFFG